MNRSVLRLLALCLSAATVLLAGCATSYVLDNTVQSFSSMAALPAAPTYRFERLPSQQAPDQVQLEIMADAALHKAGLRRDDANPRYSVQVKRSHPAGAVAVGEPLGRLVGRGLRRPPSRVRFRLRRPDVQLGIALVPPRSERHPA